MNEMSNYPPSATPNEPQRGLNSVFYPNPAEDAAFVTFSPSAHPGHSPAGCDPPPYDKYSPQGGYPSPAPVTNPPAVGAGYPSPEGNPPPRDGYSSQAGYPSPAPVTNPPTLGAGYPPPGGNPPPSDGYSAQDRYPSPALMANPPASGAGYPQPGMQPSGEGNSKTAIVPVCPPGLEYLTTIDQLIVHQKVELIEVFCSCETKNKYIIKNSLGQEIYTAKEDTDCCTRNCCGALRCFDMKIKDNAGEEVIHLYRPLRCDCCCCFCCLQVMEVMSPPGTVIGSVVQEWSILFPQYRIQNAAGETVLRIEGPLCKFSLCGDVIFKVLSEDGKTEVGNIRKQWSGVARETFTDADHFGITFPADLDVNIKAVLLGACMLIDFMFFEADSDGLSYLKCFLEMFCG